MPQSAAGSIKVSFERPLDFASAWSCSHPIPSLLPPPAAGLSTAEGRKVGGLMTRRASEAG